MTYPIKMPHAVFNAYYYASATRNAEHTLLSDLERHTIWNVTEPDCVMIARRARDIDVCWVKSLEYFMDWMRES